MTQSQTLGEWINSVYGDQGALADVLKPKVAKNTVSSWKTGRNGIPPEYQRQLRKLGFTGPWPREEEPATASGGSEEVVKLKGRVEALEGQLLAALVAAKSLDERMRKLERRSGLSE
jgi:hypothetical protein